MSERTEMQETSGKGTALPTATGAEKIRRKPRSAEPNSSGGRPKKDSSDVVFGAIQALANLPEGGRFFLTYEASDGAKVIDCWN